MKKEILDITNKLYHNHLTPETATKLLLDLFVSHDDMEEFGRNAFYKGREVSRYDERGNAIFKIPTYNGYLRELNGK